nr:hypothetical protein [Tanacetum cinerariifolium]
MAQLPPRDKRHPWLLYEGQEYTDEVIQDFKERLGRIFTMQVHRLYVLDLGALTEEMGQAITNRHRMGHIKADGQVVLLAVLGGGCLRSVDHFTNLRMFSLSERLKADNTIRVNQ